jgi:acyl carrier protein
MTRDPLLHELTGILGELFETRSAPLDSDATLRGTLLLDSLDIADFAAAVNRRLGVRAPASTYDNLRSLGAIRDFLVDYRSC